MALGTISDPNGLSQGAETVVGDMVFGTPTGNQVTVTSTGNSLPLLIDDEYVEIRDHSDSVNNGLYRVNDGSPAVGSVTLDKISGADPITATTESASIFTSIRNAENAAWENSSGTSTEIYDVGTGLPTLEIGSRIVIEDHATTDNNGTYEVTAVTVVSERYVCTKLTGNDPANAVAEAITVITDIKNVMFDTAGLGVYLLENPTAISTMDLDGALGQAFYSFAVLSWKNDAFLIANAPFLMLTIDADAGKYLIGQDPSGGNSGWGPIDVVSESIRTRKMFRNMGWTEVASDGSTLQIHAGVRTLGAFLDETEATGDTADYQFGTDTTVDDTVSFTFSGPVNEAILCYDATVTRAQATASGYDFNDSGDTIDRNDAGSFITDGYKVGGRVVVANAETPADDGTYVLTAVAALALTVENVDGSAVTFSDTLDDNTATLDIDNRFAVTLRLRERTTSGDSNARTYSASNLSAAGETSLSNRLFTFGLSNSQDLDITESDANIDGNAPYTGMTLTYYATGQAQGGSGDLVGGPYNFGIVIVGNNGTNTQVYEWTQRQLRKTTDIDADADTAIGVTMDGLMRFLGPTLQVGSVDGGLTFPTNPDGGGSGVFISGLNSASRNDTTYYDNLGTVRSHPLGVPVTLDFNQTALDDVNYTYTLYFDLTIQSTVSDLIITAGSGSDGTFDSAGAGLPASLDAGVGSYVRVTTLDAADEDMEGTYQVTALTSTSQWDVTRYDGDDIVTTGSPAGTPTIDEHPIDSPDAIIVQDDVPADVTGSDPSADVVFTFDYSGNTQGGRTASNDADVVLRTIGQEVGGAQYAATTVQTIGSTATAIPVANQIERNFNNP